jgi:putative membrane protein
MPGFLVRLLINAAGLWLAQAIVPGIVIDDAVTLLLAALLLGVVNAVVRPIIVILTLPLTVLTLGIFLLVINGLMLALVAALLPGMHVAGLGSAILGWIIVTLTSWVAAWTIGPRGGYEVLVVRG